MKVHVQTNTEGEEFIMELTSPEERTKLANRLPLLVEDSGGLDIATIDDGDETIEITDLDELIAYLQQ